MKLRILPYKMGSASAKALAQELETLRVYPDRNYRPRDNHLIVNYGFAGMPDWFGQVRADRMLNPPDRVARACNKLACLNVLFDVGVNIPIFTVERVYVKFLMQHHGRIYCRTLTQANSGRGIVIASTPEELVDAPLYTVDVGPRREYRVHVFNGKVIDYAQKKKMATETLEERGIEYCKDIRSHGRGWVFARDNITLPEEVQDVALRAIAALGLDFGAVDCYLTSKTNRNPNEAGVFEVNTAPGLEGTTLTAYVNAIREYIDAM